jgi:hypothetical protein
MLMNVEAWLQSMLIVAFLLFIPALPISNIQKIYKVVVLILTFPLLCIGSVGLREEKVLDSVQIDNNRYHLVFYRPWGDNYGDCLLYQCNSKDLECQQIRSYTGICWSPENSALEVNPNTNEINVFIGDEWSNNLNLDFTYGKQPRAYLDKVPLNDYAYYLAYFHDYGARHTPFTYMLYRCAKESTDCSRLSFRYDLDALADGYLELDEQSGEIKILIDDELIYTYSSSPKCHVEGCSLADK